MTIEVLRLLRDVLVILVISIVYLIGIISCRVPFFIIFFIGLGSFIAGLIVALFYNKGTKGRKIALMTSFSGVMSSIEIWVLVAFLLSRL